MATEHRIVVDFHSGTRALFPYVSSVIYRTIPNRDIAV